MLNMSVKKSAAAPREGTASAVREATRWGLRRRPPLPSVRSAGPSRLSTSCVSSEKRTPPSRPVLRVPWASCCGERALLVAPHRVAATAGERRVGWARGEKARAEVAQEPARRRGRGAPARARANEGRAGQGEHGHRRAAEGGRAVGGTPPEPTEEEIELGRGRFRTGRLDIKSGRRS